MEMEFVLCFPRGPRLDSIICLLPVQHLADRLALLGSLTQTPVFMALADPVSQGRGEHGWKLDD
jgi:hypothetical protein